MTLISIITSDDIVEVIHENIKIHKLTVRKGLPMQVLCCNGIIKTERKTMLNVGNAIKREIL